MEKRKLGQTGLEISVLGFGGAEIGYENATPGDVETLLGAALDAGLNVIDTAECYANSEELIGNAVAHRRDDFYLFTKCGHAADFEEDDWDVAMLRKSIDRSLERLKTDRLDLIQLHTCSKEMLERGEVIEVLEEARAAGKTRFIGYSGDNEAAIYAIECGRFDSLQTSVNIADIGDVEKKVPLAFQAGMGVIAKRPIANAAWKTGSQKPENGYVQPYWERLQALQYDFFNDSQRAVSVALRWTLAQAGVATAIVGTKNPQRWAQNAQLLEVGALPHADRHQIVRRWHEVAQADWSGQS